MVQDPGPGSNLRFQDLNPPLLPSVIDDYTLSPRLQGVNTWTPGPYETRLWLVGGKEASNWRWIINGYREALSGTLL
jgi:hypothetical protein